MLHSINLHSAGNGGLLYTIMTLLYVVSTLLVGDEAQHVIRYDSSFMGRPWALMMPGRE
jgi:hypothetical protein